LYKIQGPGAAKYNDRNWERGGIPFGRYIDSLKRHISQYEMGMEDEDHLGQRCII